MRRVAHHVNQRGSNYRAVFLSDEDCQYYLITLERQACRFELDVLAYCLMPNHVHLVVVPARTESLDLTMRETNRAYAEYACYTRVSARNPWQDRFFSCPVDPLYLPAALRYVECNPVRAGLTRRAGDWQWSSAGAHLGNCAWPSLLNWELWSGNWDCENWRGLLGEQRQVYIETLLRRATYHGCIMGSTSEPRPSDAVVKNSAWPLAYARGSETPPFTEPRPAESGRA